MPLAILVSFLTLFSKSLSDAAATSTGFTFEQQFGHLVAATLIDVLQYGHVRVVTGFCVRILFIIRTNRKIANIVIRKLTTEFKNNPIFSVVAPAAWAAATVG